MHIIQIIVYTNFKQTDTHIRVGFNYAIVMVYYGGVYESNCK